jgi:poly(A) polymerase
MEPAGRITPQPWMTAPATRAVLNALQADGTVVRFVGGCVRDAVLGKAAKDIDIATPDPPETVVALLERAGLKAVPTGIDHGTVTAVAKHQPFEVTTLREDVETDGRRAKVAFTASWVADAARRDFTMNAMFAEPDGTLFDPFGGWADLLAGRVRFVGEAEQRIREDYLRLLRFFRFHAHYGLGAPEPGGLDAATRHAGQLATLSGERVRDELLKLLDAPDPARVAATLHARDILGSVLPFPMTPDRLGHAVRIEQRHPGAGDALRRLAATFRLHEDDARRVAEILRLSRQQTKRLRAMTVGPGIALDGDGRPLRAALYRQGAEAVRDRLILAAAEVLADGGHVNDGALGAMLAAVDAWAPVRLPVGGSDVRALGIPRGPRVGELLRAVESWWIDRDFAPDRAACLAKLDELAGSGREAET